MNSAEFACDQFGCLMAHPQRTYPASSIRTSLPGRPVTHWCRRHAPGTQSIQPAASRARAGEPASADLTCSYTAVIHAESGSGSSPRGRNNRRSGHNVDADQWLHQRSLSAEHLCRNPAGCPRHRQPTTHPGCAGRLQGIFAGTGRYHGQGPWNQHWYTRRTQRCAASWRFVAFSHRSRAEARPGGAGREPLAPRPGGTPLTGGPRRKQDDEQRRSCPYTGLDTPKIFETDERTAPPTISGHDER